jgi:hypothetical protein
VIVLSGLWHARSRCTDEGVSWPCLARDPEVGCFSTMVGDILGMYVAKDLFAKIDPYDT